MRDVGNKKGPSQGSALPSTATAQAGDQFVFNGGFYDFDGTAWVKRVYDNDSRLTKNTGVATVTYVQTGLGFDAGTYVGGVATAEFNGALDPSLFNASSLAVGDRLLVRSMSVAEDYSAMQLTGGIYRIVALGSASVPWQLQRTTDFPTIESSKGATIVALNGLNNTAMSQWTLVDLGVFLANPALSGRYAVVGIQTQPNYDKGLEVDSFGSLGARFGTTSGTVAQGSDSRFTSALVRSNHTGTQIASTISDFAAAVRSTLSTSSQSVNVGGQRISNLGDPANPQEAATKAYVDSRPSSGGSVSVAPRSIRGLVRADGAPLVGTGYTVAKTSVGQYTVTFTTPFSGAIAPDVWQYAQPTGGFSNVNVTLANIDTWTNNGTQFKVYVTNSGGTQFIDAGFGFEVADGANSGVISATTTWNPLTITGGASSAYWTGQGWNPPGYYKDHTGRIYLRGMITTPNASPAGQVLFTLPVGFRPARPEQLVTNGQGVVGVVTIQPTGECQWGGGTANGWFSLDSLSFMVSDGPYALTALGTTVPGNRIIQGNVNEAGGITRGSGFTVVRSAAGRYRVTFAEPFSTVPNPVITEFNSLSGLERNVRIDDVSTTSFALAFYNDASAAFADSAFTFLVVDGGSNSVVSTTTPWLPLALSGAWVNYDSGATFNIPGYYRDHTGRVSLRGLVKNGTTTNIGVLPPGYRPVKQGLFTAVSNTGMARIDVLTTGEIQLTSYGTGGSNAFVALDGISFVTSDGPFALSSGSFPSIIEPATPWWGTLGSPAVPAGRTELGNGTGADSRITISNPTATPQRWKLSATTLLRANTGNWTPIFFMAEMYDNGSGTMAEQRQARAYSNTGAGNDWSTLTLPARPFTVAPNTTRVIVPAVQFVGYGGNVNRDNDYHDFHAIRVS